MAINTTKSRFAMATLLQNLEQKKIIIFQIFKFIFDAKTRLQKELFKNVNYKK